MAITSNPLIGRASGKISNFEFLTIKSRNVIRSSKLKRYKNYPASVISNQAKLKLFCQGLSGFKLLIKECYTPKKKIWNPLNSFVSYNYPFFSTVDDRVLSLDSPEDVIICNSNLILPNNPYDIVLGLRSVEFKVLSPVYPPDCSLNGFLVCLFNGMSFSVLSSFGVSGFPIITFTSNLIYTSDPPRQTDFYFVPYIDNAALDTRTYYKSIYLGRYEL